MSSEAEPPRPVTKLPDRTKALKTWLQANGLGSMTEAGFAPLGMYTLASGRPHLPPMPNQVLFDWSLLLDDAIIHGQQSAAAFIGEARKAGIPDERIRRALQVDDDVDLDQHADQLRTQARAYAIRRGQSGGWMPQSDLPPPAWTQDPSQDQPRWRISVEMDHSSTPLWIKGSAGRPGANIRQLDFLPLGTELISDLHAWAEEWHRAGEGGTTPEEDQRWLEQGRALTGRVQAALGDGYDVIYRYDEDSPPPLDAGPAS